MEKNKAMTEHDWSAIQVIVKELPELPSFMLQRWAGAVEAMEALRAQEQTAG